jgi:hypothetical protein
MKIKLDFPYLVDISCRAKNYFADPTLDKAINKIGKIL